MQPQQPRLNYRRQKLARQYARLMTRLSLVQSTVVATIFLVLLFGGFSVKLSRFLAFPQPWASALYFIILVVGLGIILMPLQYYQGFILPHRFNLSHQTFTSWLADRGKAGALSFLLGLVLIVVVYWLLQYLPGSWWLWVAMELVLVSLLLSRLTPTLLLGMFYKLEPLADKKLKERLMNLAKRAGAPLLGVFTMDLSSKSTTANAMLAGLGRTRRIVLTDTLLEKYSPDEVEAVLAHELGHHIHKDVPKLITVQAAMIFAGLYSANLVLRASLIPFGFNGVADAAALPLLFLTVAVLTMMLTPLTNTYSRHVEAAADEAAIELTDKPQAFISAMTRLTNQNLSVANPSRWVELLFYDHPSYTKRVNSARRNTLKLVKEATD
jgi:STE24 endopeptidase